MSGVPADPMRSVERLTMRFGIRVASILILAVALSHPPVLGRPTGPITVEVSPSTVDMKTGDEVTSTLAFRALEDVDRLEVKLSAMEGVEILSTETTAVFDAIKLGEAAELKVKVRLTAPKYGELAILYEAFVGDDSRGGVTGVTYGNPKD